MRCTCSPRAALALLVGAMVLCASSLQAQNADYNSLIGEGLQEFEAGHWAEAYSLFQQAHAESPNARSLRGMGICSYELRAYARALEELNASLTHADKPLSEEQRIQVQALIGRAKRRVGTLAISLQPEGAQLLVNNELTTKREIVVRVGTVTVRAILEGYQSEERVVNVAAGQRSTLDIRLTPVAGGAPPLAAAAPRATADEPQLDDDGGGSVLTTPVIIAIGVAGAGLITMAVAGPMALSEESDLSSCKPTCSNDELSDLHTYTLLADIGLGAMVIGGAVAGILILTGADDEQASTPALTPYADTRSVGVMTRGTF